MSESARATLAELARVGRQRTGPFPVTPPRKVDRRRPLPYKVIGESALDAGQVTGEPLDLKVITDDWPATDLVLLRHALRSVHPIFEVESRAMELHVELAVTRLQRPLEWLWIAIQDVLPVAHALHPFDLVTYGQRVVKRTR